MFLGQERRAGSGEVWPAFVVAADYGPCAVHKIQVRPAHRSSLIAGQQQKPDEISTFLYRPFNQCLA